MIGIIGIGLLPPVKLCLCILSPWINVFIGINLICILLHGPKSATIIAMEYIGLSWFPCMLCSHMIIYIFWNGIQIAHMHLCMIMISLTWLLTIPILLLSQVCGNTLAKCVQLPWWLFFYQFVNLWVPIYAYCIYHAAKKDRINII